MVLSRILKLSASSLCSFIINTTVLFPFSLKSREPSRFPTGATFLLMNTTISSTKQLELKENSEELITNTGTLALLLMLSKAWKLTSLDTLEAFITGTSLEISLPQMLSETMIELNSELSLDSLSLVSGRQIGVKVTACQQDNIFSKKFTTQQDIFSTLLSCMTSIHS